MSIGLTLPESLGFRVGSMSAHTSRTAMMQELALLLAHVPANSPPEAYATAIIEENILGKPTRTTRQRSSRRLVELYSLDPGVTLFRLLRHFWPADSAGQPMLALLIAAARDPLLREATPLVLAARAGESVNATGIAEQLDRQYPGRFRPTTLHSTAQNLASSWTQAGYLRGKVKKIRTKPVVTPVVMTLALLLGHLCGIRGKLLLDCFWTRLLDQTPAELTGLAQEASKQGWLRYKGVGAVVEITFPGLLRPNEEQAAYEPD